MNDQVRKITLIPANPEMVKRQKTTRQLRVAAYCRVSTDDEEQLTSYEAQQAYYTDKIMTNPAWTIAGIFADEGITGTSARKRPEFLHMIRLCRQKKIDVVLTKSISRFARNTVDCLNYIRVLKALGIAVIFEKENINTLESDSEILITMMGAFAQAESESMSANIRWGKRQAMREGKVSIQYKWLYGYRRGADGQPEVVPEQAKVVRWIFEKYLAGASLRMIAQELEGQEIPNINGNVAWDVKTIRAMLANEKYRGDVLLQKTFISDCIERKVIRNTGQLPKYLIENNHPAIIPPEMFDRVQAESARRNAIKSASRKAPTGRSCYASKYALSERLFCGECGTRYQRCTWNKRGKKQIVWRCVSRVEYGSKYCHDSPTMEERPLQEAILAAINRVMSDKKTLIWQIKGAMELELVSLPGQTMSLADIDKRLEELAAEFDTILDRVTEQEETADCLDDFQAIANEIAALKEQKRQIEDQHRKDAAAVQKLADTAQALEEASPAIQEWNEGIIRQLVDSVKVISKEKIIVGLSNGIQIEQTVVQ